MQNRAPEKIGTAEFLQTMPTFFKEWTSFRKRPSGIFLAESVRFELTVGYPITSFQDWLLKPLGQLSIWLDDTIIRPKSQAFAPARFIGFTQTF